jgi:hypothetical protein
VYIGGTHAHTIGGLPPGTLVTLRNLAGIGLLSYFFIPSKLVGYCLRNNHGAVTFPINLNFL